MKHSIPRHLIIFILFFNYSIFGQGIFRVAGTGVGGDTGDGGSAINATFWSPIDVATDSYGNIYIADPMNHKIKKIDQNGIITTFAGTGLANFNGDSIAAINANIGFVNFIAIDKYDNIYFTATGRIRKIDTNGIITTIAGDGTVGFSADGSLAINAKLYGPQEIFINKQNEIFFIELYNERIRKIDASGKIYTVAGDGVSSGPAPDNVLAINASAACISGLTVDTLGNIYFGDLYNKLRKINTNGMLSTVAGDGTGAFGGDGDSAKYAQLYHVEAIAITNDGAIYFLDSGNSRLRKIKNGIITTVCGNGTTLCSGDGGLAINASLGEVTKGLKADKEGNLLFCESNDKKVRKICNTNCLQSINEINNKQFKMSISPNPNNGKFHFNLDTNDEYTVSIYNGIGQLVTSKINSTGLINFDLSEFDKGIYNIVVKIDNTTQSEKVIIQ